MPRPRVADKKKPVSISLNNKTNQLKVKILEHHDLTLSKLVEIWIHQEAERLGLKIKAKKKADKCTCQPFESLLG
jgi:hypothetical protein